MKYYKILFAAVAYILVLCSESNAQSNYWKTNGNTVMPGQFLGSTNNQNLRFRVNNYPRLRIMSNSGFVGLGNYNVFAPAAFLHINQPSQHYPDGHLFRTDGAASLDLSWSMFSSVGGGSLTQKARFLLSPNTLTQGTGDPWESNMINDPENHLRIESTLGDLVFRAHGANSTQGGVGVLAERMRITSALYMDPHWGTQPVSTTRISISSRPGEEVTQPLAMLHIGDPWFYQLGGHREWMNSGTYMQRGSDNVFFGLRPRENTSSADSNDAVIAWGDNDAPPSRLDALRIVFAGPYDDGASPGEAEHLNGLETMRIHPRGNIGMGDFSVNGLDQAPTEKLDIDGRLRVREVPLDTTPEVLIVGREIDSIGDYVLNHLSFPGDNSLFLSGTGEWLPGGGTDCRWKDIASPILAGQTDMFTGNNPQEECYRGKVAIGTTDTYKSKVNVMNTLERDSVLIGIYSGSRCYLNENKHVIGVYGNADSDGYPGSSSANIGVQGIGNDSRYVVGVNGIGNGYPTGQGTGVSIGIRGYADNAVNNRNYAIYGEVPTSSGYSGYFVGGVVVHSGPPVSISDQSVKNNIGAIGNASQILTSLQPKTYYYQSPENRPIAFEEDMQYGFIAQEVQEVLPDLVEQVHVPEMSDSTGFLEGTSTDLLGIQYEAFIPILVAGFQEQDATQTDQAATIAAQNEQIANLEAQVNAQAGQLQEMQDQLADMLLAVQAMQAKTANCCNCPPAGSSSDVPPSDKAKEIKLYQNTPNPFENQTRIAFNLPQDAAVILEITDAAGRPLERIVDTHLSEGQHTVTWDGSAYAPGVYFYSLYADGQLLTRKMIKQ